MIVHFDPVRHPRDRLGQFRKALKALKDGDTLRLPGGVAVTRRDDFNFRIHAPHAKTLNKPIDVKTYELDKAAHKALDRSANTPHPGTLGGADTASTYAAVRQAELEARARDPEWSGISPEDEEDLFTRPLHGDVAKNEEWLNDIKQEATDEMEGMENDLLPMDRETGVRDFRTTGDEQRYLDAQDRLDRANAALKQIDGTDGGEALPPPPLSPGIADAPIGRLHTLAPFEIQPVGDERRTAQPGEKMDVLRDSGGAWLVRTPDKKFALIPKEEPYHRDRQTPFFHEDFFPEPPKSPGIGKAPKFDKGDEVIYNVPFGFAKGTVIGHSQDGKHIGVKTSTGGVGWFLPSRIRRKL